MTKRQKYIASCGNPYYNGFATKNEVKLAKRLARGKYWYDVDYEEYVSFSPKGYRKYFPCDNYDCKKSKMKILAKKWAGQ